MLLLPECHSPKAGTGWHAWCGGYRLRRLLSRRALQSAASRAALRMRCSCPACSPPHQPQLFMPSHLSHPPLKPYHLLSITLTPLTPAPLPQVFMPSHLSHIDYERVHADGANIAITAATAGDSFYDDSEDEEEYFDDSDAAYARAAAATECTGDERTGLGVAGVLRRLRLWAREYGERGFILLEAKELTRWCKAVQR